jgi:hypothetical protein
MTFNKYNKKYKLEMPSCSHSAVPGSKLLSKLEIKHVLSNPNEDRTIKNLKQVRSTLTKVHYEPYSLFNKLDQHDVDPDKKVKAYEARMKASLRHDVQSHWYYTSLIQLAGGVPLGFASRSDEATAFAETGGNGWERRVGFERIAFASKHLLDVLIQEGFYDKESINQILQKFKPKDGELSPDITFEYYYTDEFKARLKSNARVQKAIKEYNRIIAIDHFNDKDAFHSLSRKVKKK